MTWRPPYLRKGYNYMANRVGEETAHRLCETNPRAVVEGAPRPSQPEPVGLWDYEPMKFRARKFTGPRGKNAPEDDDRNLPREGQRGFFKTLFRR
jgi:hypothetical protein